ncbi:MAG: glycosyltransferase family 4 protein, partial [Planctomycetota bacterium]
MPAEDSHVRLLHVTTVPASLGFLSGQAAYMRPRGFDSSALSSPDALLEKFAASEDVSVDAVEMTRRISPLCDLFAVVKLCRRMRRIRPHLVHSHTPKGGLLGMIAAWLVGVPVRVYHMRGLPLATKKGWKRAILRVAERISCRLSHRVVCVSRSLADVAVDEGLCPAEKIKVLAHGSGNGVDATRRFNPSRLDREAGRRVRNHQGIPPDALVAGFVGRVVRDKGVEELAEAYRLLRDRFPSLHLLIVGPFEPEDPVPPRVERLLRRDDRVHLVGHAADVPSFYAAMDVLVLPTYREGFPNVLLEAAAMTLPVVATKVCGCTDAVDDGV